MDARRRHQTSEKSAETISDRVHYLLEDFSFASRRNLCHVLKLCVLVLSRPSLRLPDVSIDLSGCVVPNMCITSALRCVQSYVMSPHYRQGGFFTEATMKGVRDAIAGARGFMSDATSDPWSSIG